MSETTARTCQGDVKKPILKALHSHEQQAVDKCDVLIKLIDSVEKHRELSRFYREMRSSIERLIENGCMDEQTGENYLSNISDKEIHHNEKIKSKTAAAREYYEGINEHVSCMGTYRKAYRKLFNSSETRSSYSKSV